VFQLSQGQVVEVEIPDPRGKNTKRRPVVLLTATNELATVDTYVVGAISATLKDPVPPDWVLLPWSADGRARTGLKKPSAAKCDWLTTVNRAQILSVLGTLPGSIMQEIMQRVVKKK